MTKVYKSVGAVAVYSPWRAAAVAGAATVVVAGAGFAVGMAAGDDSAQTTRTVAHVTTVVRTPPRAAPVDATAPAPSAPRPKRGYLRGYRAGAASVFGGSNDFRAGSAYMVRLRSGANGALTIGPHIGVVAGTTYFLCAGGTRLCMR